MKIRNLFIIIYLLNFYKAGLPLTHGGLQNKSTGEKNTTVNTETQLSLTQLTLLTQKTWIGSARSEDAERPGP